MPPADGRQLEPPHAADIERGLLGAMMAAPHITDEVRTLLRSPEVFWNDANAAVYSAILRAADAAPDGRFDMAVVKERLAAAGTLDDVGGPAYLMRCFDERTDAIAAYSHYCAILNEKFQRRQIFAAGQRAVRLALEEPDLPTVVDRASSALLTALAPTSAAREVSLGDAADRVLAAIEQQAPSVYPTAIPAFDKDFGGLPRSGVVTVTGVPGSGKSSLVANQALRLALEEGAGVRVFSYEMPAAKLAASMLASEARQPVHRYGITGERPKDFSWASLVETAERFRGANLAFIEDNTGASEIFNRCVAYRKRGVSCIVVDYIQNLPGDQRFDSDAAKIAESARIMQRIAVELGMLVFVVSQMTLQAMRQNRPPQLGDMEGSGAIAKVSDMVLGVYREAVFTPREDGESEESWTRRKQTAELHIVKNKFGPLGAVPLYFRPEWTKFMGEDERAYASTPDAAWEAGA